MCMFLLVFGDFLSLGLRCGLLGGSSLVVMLSAVLLAVAVAAAVEAAVEEL